MHYFKVFVCLLFFNTLVGIEGVGANVLGSEAELTRLKEQAIYYLSKKQPERAYETLKPAELVYAGDAQYNYLLGMAAIDSGHPEDASWAFERVVAVMPHHAGARMDMARAFFQLKDYPRAEKEFQLLQAMNP
ncbi:tetratricopeptide repeat protein, partial [Oceanospirillum sp. HFRX-1_2]